MKLLLILCLGALSAHASPSPDLVNLDELLSRAHRDNLDLRAARERRRASRHLRPQAVSLPDPRLTLGVFLEEVQTRVGPQQLALGLQQTFPTGGKIPLRGRVADNQAEEVWEQLRSLRREVSYQVRQAFYEIWFHRRSQEITREMHTLVRSGEEVARTRYAAGRGGQEVVLKAQVELGTLEDRLRSHQEMERPLVDRLNALLDRPAGTPLGPLSPTDLRETDLPSSRKDLHRSLRTSSPELRQVNLRADRARLQGKLARKARIPDLTLGLRWTRTGDSLAPTPGSGNDPLLATVGINLPLRRGRDRARERSQELERSALLHSAAGLENKLETRLEQALFDHQDGLRRLRLYRDDLVPKGRQSLEASFTSFQAGRSSFLDLLDAERILLNFELAHAAGMRDHLLALAEIERIVGSPGKATP